MSNSIKTEKKPFSSLTGSPNFRKWGSIACENCFKGIVTMLQDFTVCKKGDIINPEQAKILVKTFLFLLLQSHFSFLILLIESNLFVM